MKKDIKQFTEGAKKKGIPTPSAILADGSLVEMVYVPEENRTRFAIFRDDKLTYEEALKNIKEAAELCLVLQPQFSDIMHHDWNGRTRPWCKRASNKTIKVPRTERPWKR